MCKQLCKNFQILIVLLGSVLCDLPLPIGNIKQTHFIPPVQKCDKTFNEDFQALTQLGQGFFGEVRKSDYNKVIKKICPNKFTSQEYLSLEKNKEIYFLSITYQEAKNQNLTDNFIKFFNCYTNQQGCFYLELEMKGDSLGYIISKKESISYKFLDLFQPDERQNMYLDFLQALRSMHQLSIIHCDIKPDNLLLDIKLDNYQQGYQTQLPHISIADYGLALYENENVQITNKIFNHPIILQLMKENQNIPALKNYDVYSAILSIFTIENYKMGVRDMGYFTHSNESFYNKIIQNESKGFLSNYKKYYQKYFNVLKKEIFNFIDQDKEYKQVEGTQNLENCNDFYCILYQSITENINSMPSLDRIIENIQRVLQPNQQQEPLFNAQQDHDIVNQNDNKIDQDKNKINQKDNKIEQNDNKIDQNQPNPIQGEELINEQTEKITLNDKLSQQFYIEEPRMNFSDQTYTITLKNDPYQFKEQNSMLLSSLYYDIQNQKSDSQFVFEIQKNAHFNIEEKQRAFDTFNNFQLQEYFIYDEFPELKQQSSYDTIFCVFRYKINFMFIKEDFFQTFQSILQNSEINYYKQFLKLFKGIKQLHDLNLVHMQISPLTVVQAMNQDAKNLNLKFTNLGFYKKDEIFKKDKSLRNISQFTHSDIERNKKVKDFVISDKFDIYSLSLTCLFIFMQKGVDEIQRIIPQSSSDKYENQIITNILKQQNIDTMKNVQSIDDCNFVQLKQQFVCIMISSIKRNLNEISSIDSIIQKLDSLTRNLILI